MDKYKIENVECLTQRNNLVNAFSTCYPTSLSMAINYCLGLKGKSKEDIGVDTQEQIEDHITRITMSPEMVHWATTDADTWVKDYVEKLWLVAQIEVRVFNDLMAQFGFQSRFFESLTFDQICDKMEETNLPQVVFGYFASVSPTIKGHINCMVGFDRQQRKFIIHDPFGNANEKYANDNGAYVEYSFEQFFTKDEQNKTGWLHNIYSIKGA